MRNRFIPVFSFTHVGALYRSTLHSAVHSIRRNDQKSAPARGGGWDALEAPAERLRRTCVPGCGNAASNSKTDIEPAIFPKSLRSCVLKNA